MNDLEKDYEMINNLLVTTKKIAEEVNRKKKNFRKLKDLEDQIEENGNIFFDSFPRLEFKTTLPARSHVYKNSKVSDTETCIICKKPITNEAVKCTLCGFWAHKICSLDSKFDCFPKNSEHIDISSNRTREIVKKIKGLICITPKKTELKIDLIIFSDSLLLVSKQINAVGKKN
eukprot:TRINITY_DN7536_c0_g1_i1.p1 TRINITY_DN7536_c0_g1~~TRINITY_DN7536_c0_g1_i1.p1  ORF type:complete len:174 (+),score=43.18 TRINITY_DN7536_c0_g1_i1:3-524(+)